MEKVKIGVIGTSWWADAMYLPALQNGENIDIVSVCGRNPERTEEFANLWSIPHWYTDYNKLIAAGGIDALIILTGNETHYPITMAALAANLHVLCEKPLGLTYTEAKEMAAVAAAKELITLVPFTYRFMPTTRYLKHLIDDGYLGQPYHCHLRYYAGFGRGKDYAWRFDKTKAGSGALGDIGSHFLYLADWFYGEIDAVCANLGSLVDRTPTDPSGNRYELADDTAMLMLRFKNGAHGMVHATTLAYEENEFGQIHEFDLHGSKGTLRQRIDWDQMQQITGTQEGQGPSDQVIEVPQPFWGDVRRDHVISTYKDTYRLEGHMVRDFANAIAAGESASPDFADGARIQRVLDAGLLSAAEGRWVSVEEIR